MIVSIVIIVLVFLLPLVSSTLRESKFVLISYLFVVLLHQAVVVSDVFVTALVNIEPDAFRFHDHAEILVMHTLEVKHIYSEFLAFFYKLFGVSYFLGAQLSILAFAVSCIVFLKLKRLLNIYKHSAVSLLVFGALPTMVFLGSTTLRESYELLFFMLSAFYAIKMIRGGRVAIYIVPMVLAILALGLTHRGLLNYAIFLTLLSAWWIIFSAILQIHNKLSPFLKVTGLIASSVFIVLVPTIIGWGTVIETLFPERLNELIAAYETRGSVVQYRADYPGLDLSSPYWPILSGGRVYFYFLFSPFPWQIENLSDLYAFGEVIIRITLLISLLLLRRASNSRDRKIFSFLLCLYFSMVFMWAIGTTNYGTAIRHHLVTWWILVLGLPFAIEWIKTKVLVCLVSKHKRMQPI